MSRFVAKRKAPGPIAAALRWGAMDDRKDIVAVGLLTALDLERLGRGFTRAYPVEEADSFADILEKLEAIEWPPGDRDRSAGRQDIRVIQKCRAGAS